MIEARGHVLFRVVLKKKQSLRQAEEQFICLFVAIIVLVIAVNAHVSAV